MNSDRWTEGRHLREQERSELHGAWPKPDRSFLWIGLTLIAVPVIAVAAWAIGGN